MTKVTLCFQINLPDSDRCSGEKANFILGCHYTNQLNSNYKSEAIERSLGRGRKGKSSVRSVNKLLLMWYSRQVLFSPSLCSVLCTTQNLKEKLLWLCQRGNCCYFCSVSALVALATPGFLPHVCPFPLAVWVLDSLSRPKGRPAQIPTVMQRCR